MPFIKRKINAGSFAMLPAWLGAIVGFFLALAVAVTVAVVGLIGFGIAFVRRAFFAGDRPSVAIPRPVPKPAVEAIPMQRADDGTWRSGENRV